MPLTQLERGVTLDGKMLVTMQTESGFRVGVQHVNDGLQGCPYRVLRPRGAQPYLLDRRWLATSSSEDRKILLDNFGSTATELPSEDQLVPQPEDQPQSRVATKFERLVLAAVAQQRAVRP